MPSDPLLVQRLLNGDRGAGDALFGRHAPILTRVLRRRLGPGFGPADADNVLQQSWLLLLEDGGRRLRRYDLSRPLLPFLIGVALNACRDYRRQERLRRAADPGSEPVQPVPSGETESVREALEALLPRDRLLLDLVELQGLGYAEAARILGLAPGSIGPLASLARARLREVLGKRRSPSGSPPPRA